MQPRDNKRARLLPSATLGDLDSDLLFQCASYLDADGLARIGRTSAVFGIPQPGQRRSLVNEIAHQGFGQNVTDEERSRLPRHEDESEVGLYRAMQLLRQPLCFDELVGEWFSPREHPASVTCTGRGCSFGSTAMSGYAMRGGMHYVEFEITNHKQQHENLLHLGVIRPVSLTDGIDLEADWEGDVSPTNVSSTYLSVAAEKLRSQRTAKWGDSNVHCCTYYCGNGRCCWTDWNNERNVHKWQGIDGLGGSGKIVLLLDLDEGSLSIFKNGRRLGVMKVGMGGEYCWFVSACSACTISMSRCRAPG